MKVIVIGATGTIGKAVTQALTGRHEVIGAHRKSSPSVDIEKPETIESLLAVHRNVDAVVCVAGGAAWKPLEELTDEDFAMSLRNKLMGQVNVIRSALRVVRDHGSITVTSGALAQRPMKGSAAVSLVNAGVEAFARAAALEAPRGIRVNAVSPPWVSETLAAMGSTASDGMPARDVAQAYVAAVEGQHRGEVLDPRAIL